MRKGGADLTCSCAALRRAARRVTQAYDQVLKPAGIRVTQYSLLSRLAEHGSSSVTDLAERMEMDRTTLTRNLKPLRAAGWLRQTAGADRRSRAIEITDAGLAVLAQAHPLWEKAERGFRAALGQRKTSDLVHLLDDTLEGFPR